MTTAHSHDPATQVKSPRSRPVASLGSTPSRSRPWWLLPGLAAAIVVGGLVAIGFVPLSTVLYAGLFGGMFLMHAGGHGGHGGHDASGGRGGHDAHGDGPTREGAELSASSAATQLRGSRGDDKLDDQVLQNRDPGETNDHEKHGSHGCH